MAGTTDLAEITATAGIPLTTAKAIDTIEDSTAIAVILPDLAQAPVPGSALGD